MDEDEQYLAEGLVEAAMKLWSHIHAEHILRNDGRRTCYLPVSAEDWLMFDLRCRQQAEYNASKNASKKKERV